MVVTGHVCGPLGVSHQSFGLSICEEGLGSGVWDILMLLIIA